MSNAQVESAYNCSAAGWEKKLKHLKVPEFYDGAWKLFSSEFSRLNPRGPIELLDCGIGDGAFSLSFARQLNSPPRITGVDLSANMLKRAAETLRNEGLEFSLHKVDVRELPFENDRFDFVVCAHVIEHMAYPSHALNEMLRVLKPGGYLVLSATKRSIFGRLVQFLWRSRVFSAYDVARMLSDVGFENSAEINVSTDSLASQLSVVLRARKPRPAISANS